MELKGREKWEFECGQMYRVGICYCSREDDGLKDGIVEEIDTDEFRTTIRGRDLDTVGCKSPASIEDPEAILGVNYHGLDAD